MDAYKSACWNSLTGALHGPKEFLVLPLVDNMYGAIRSHDFKFLEGIADEAVVTLQLAMTTSQPKPIDTDAITASGSRSLSRLEHCLNKVGIPDASPEGDRIAAGRDGDIVQLLQRKLDTLLYLLDCGGITVRAGAN